MDRPRLRRPQAAALLLALAGTLGCAQAPGAEGPPAADPPAAGASDSLTPLVEIPAGSYRPLYAEEGADRVVPRPPFRLERHAVTNEQFLAFVRAEPSWRRSQVSPLFADANYLAHWPEELAYPAGAGRAPVTHVSWFAARAYARWAGRRLPTLAEWESVGMASATSPDGRDEEGYNQRILNWYSRPTLPIPPDVGGGEADWYGVHDMHGLIWEWVEDFNSTLVTGESRGDSGLERNLFCGAGSQGAVDPSDYAAFMRFAFRGSLEGRFTVANLGFRCAADRIDP